MKTSVLCIFILVLTSNCTYSQKRSDAKFVIRDIDNETVYVNLCSKENNTDSLYYVRYNGELIKIKCDLEFWDGAEILSSFIDALYYTRYNYNYQEMNDRVCYCIIFDEYLHIQDIRFTKRFHNNDLVSNYLMVYSILLKTEGHWRVNDESIKSWHMYEGHKYFY